MKKSISLLLVLAMLFSLAACAASNRPEGAGADVPTTQQTNGTDPTNQTDPTQGSEEHGDKYEDYAKISGKSIYVNYKNGRRDNVKSSSVVFHGTAVDLVAFAYDDGEGFSGTPADALALINDGRILDDIYMYTFADFHDYDTAHIIDIQTTENMEINGYDMQKFTGVVVDDNGLACYVYGYAFVIEGTPCVLAGFVLSEGQEQSLIDAINVEVDTMVKTIRTEFELN